MPPEVSTDPGEDGFEERLRELLGRGVPELAAPPDRMSQVMRRVLRFRRRRAAVLTAVGTVAVVCGALLLPRAATEASAPVSPAARPSSPGTPSTSPTSVDGVRNTVVQDVSVPLSGTWHAVDGTDEAAVVHGYLANGPSVGSGVCAGEATGDYPCVPVTRLTPGDAVVSFTVGGIPLPSHDGRAFEVAKPKEAGAACRAIGGTAELLALGRERHDSQGSPAVDAHVCMRTPEDEALAEIVKILALSTFANPQDQHDDHDDHDDHNDHNDRDDRDQPSQPNQPDQPNQADQPNQRNQPDQPDRPDPRHQPESRTTPPPPSSGAN
ncbi:hypothetical protein [Streptomyces sp. NPDC050560]|uniref:hypothetical protein n=1 Tax=Streptomyces sp. NPDC050560 TaxID=3365630 RepID=UPI0037957E13